MLKDLAHGVACKGKGSKQKVVFSLKSKRREPAASIYIDDSASADLGELDHLYPELANIPTYKVS